METPGPAKAAQERQRRPSSHQCTSLIACESASLDKVVLFDDPVRLLEKLLEVSRDPVDRVRIMLIDDDLAVGPAVVWSAVVHDAGGKAVEFSERQPSRMTPATADARVAR